MIPNFIDIGGPWKVLPPGMHEATMDEIKIRYTITGHRLHLFTGLEQGVDALYSAGCTNILLDGSYVTEKSIPKDYDVCWDPNGVDTKKLDPVFFDFSNNRRDQKNKYYGEYFPINAKANNKNFFSDFFQIDKHTGKLKGIIKMKL